MPAVLFSVLVGFMFANAFLRDNIFTGTQPLVLRSGVLRTPECGAELSLPTADLFGRALTRTPEQIRWSKS